MASIKDNLITKLYVAPEYHRRGIGRELFNQAENIIRKAGYSEITLGALGKSPIAFYESMGLTISGTKSVKLGGSQNIIVSNMNKNIKNKGGNKMDNFQRKGSISNAHVGRDFEEVAKNYFTSIGIFLDTNVTLEIGIEGKKKAHHFDLGNLDKKILVECKSHKWTKTGRIPSAKITTWTQAMYYFHAAPTGYRKIFFVLKDIHTKSKEETLAKYYLRLNDHLIPGDVEFWEYDEETKSAQQIR